MSDLDWLGWLPSLEILGNSWNIYGLICLLTVFVSCVYFTKRTKKPLFYRVILSSVLVFCLQLTFVDNLGALTSQTLNLASGNYVNILFWPITISSYIIDFRISFIILPTAFLLYFTWLDRKSPEANRIFNWRSKWIWISAIFEVAILTLFHVIGICTDVRHYPFGSFERLALYYFAYVPSYTLFAIGGVKLFSRKEK